MRLVALVLGALIASAAWAGTARISGTAPTEYTDGSPLTDLMSYRIVWGCTAPGAYTFQELIPADVPTFEHELVSLPDTGTCYFAATALNGASVESVRSNEALKVMGVLGQVPPTPTTAPNITCQPANLCADAPAGAVTYSFNFRAAVAGCAAVDPPGSVAVIGTSPLGTATPYTAARGYGWEVPAEGRNRACSSATATLAGTNQVALNAAADAVFRVDVPPGRYLVRLAAGDAGAANRAVFELRDGTNVLYALTERAVAQNQYVDALGVTRATPAAWIAGNGAREVTITTGVFRVVLKRPSDRSSPLAHLSLEPAP